MVTLNKFILNQIVLACLFIRSTHAYGSEEDFIDTDNKYHDTLLDPQDVAVDKVFSNNPYMDAAIYNKFNFTPPARDEMDRLKKYVQEMEETMAHNANWTSCEEFVNGSNLDLKKLVELEWQIYIVWYENGHYGTIIKFSIPSKTVVQRYRSVLGGLLIEDRFWESAELLMESNFEFAVLLMRTDVPGIYSGVTEVSMTNVLLRIGLKISESGHLGMMNCKERILFGFAPQDLFPSTADEALETIPQFKYKSELHPRLLISPKEELMGPYRGPDTRKPMSIDYGNIESPKYLTIF